MSKIHKILINGKWLETDVPVKVVNPYDGSTVGVTYLASGSLIEEAVASSAEAFKKIKKFPAYKRAEIIERVAEGLIKREEEFARTIALEAGKPIKDARGEVKRAIGTFRIALEEAKRMEGEVLPLDVAHGSEGRLGIVKRFPIGPVLGITPFNFPLNLVAHKVAPAMACGNPIIIKPAPKTPLTSLMLGEVVTEAGWPEGGLNVVPCSNEDAERLATDERIKKLTFTGSAKVGWMLKAKSGMKRVTLELGGNAGCIVHSDADIELAAQRCVLGAFSYAGQICISVQRIYVHKDVFERFKGLFIENCRKLKSGDPLDETTDVGPMIEEAASVRTQEWVKEAVNEGATVLLGGKRRGSFFEPTVLTNTRPSMKVCGEEVFAPLAAIERYEEFNEAIDAVNSTLYGLQAGVFTKDLSRVMYAYETLDVGGVIVNDIPTYRVDNMPYGGVKMSGFGREGVRYAIEEMTELKLLALKG